MLGEALARNGEKQKAREILHRIEDMATRDYVDPWAIGRLYVALGDSENAIPLLGRSIEERSTLALFAPIDPLLEPLRTDARFRELVTLLHLPPAPRSAAGRP
jgi:hypothetical protein